MSFLVRVQVDPVLSSLEFSCTKRQLKTLLFSLKGDFLHWPDYVMDIQETCSGAHA